MKTLEEIRKEKEKVLKRLGEIEELLKREERREEELSQVIRIPDIRTFITKGSISAEDGRVIVSHYGAGCTYELVIYTEPSRRTLKPDYSGLEIQVESTELAYGIREVIFAVKNEELLSTTLTGILFQAADGKVNLTAADGFRLACTSVPCEVISEGSVIVPAKVAKILPSLGGRIAIGGRDVCLAKGHCGEITFFKAFGNFPNYKNLIPADNLPNQVVIRSRELIEEIKKPKEKLVFILGDGEVEMCHSLFDNGEMSTFKLQAETRGNGRVALSPKFLLDIARITPSFKMMWDSPTALVRVETKRGLHTIAPICEGGAGSDEISKATERT